MGLHIHIIQVLQNLLLKITLLAHQLGQSLLFYEDTIIFNLLSKVHIQKKATLEKEPPFLFFCECTTFYMSRS